jgi:hypothetical protein
MVDSQMETGLQDALGLLEQAARKRTISAATATIPGGPVASSAAASSDGSEPCEPGSSQDSHSKQRGSRELGSHYLITRLTTTPIKTRLGSVWPTIPIQMLRNRFAG